MKKRNLHKQQSAGQKWSFANLQCEWVSLLTTAKLRLDRATRAGAAPSRSQFCLIAFIGVVCCSGLVRGGDNNWPSFRGKDAQGIAEGTPLPEKWNVEKSEGLKWKTKLPGLGLSSPVIWEDQVFITTAVREGGDEDLKVGLYGDIAAIKEDVPQSWRLISLDRKTGKVLWDQEAYKGVPKVKRHAKSSHANSSAATDGKHVVAFFGSEGLYCYDMSGKLLWKKDLGMLDSGFYMIPDAQWGFASSPIIHEGRVIVQCDVQKGSFLAAFDVNDGKEIWRTARDEVPTWSTPTVVREGEQTQIIVNGYKHIGGYNFADGKELWKLVGGGDIPVPTPVVKDGLAFITNAHGFMAPIYAVKTSARGTLPTPGGPIASEHLAWFEAKAGNYMQTPMVYGDYLYSCRDNGVLTCFEAKSGKQVYKERLGDGSTGFTASSVAGDGKIYYTSEEGDVFVVKAGPKFELLSRHVVDEKSRDSNPLNEFCMASPAISQGNIFFRTQRHVVCVGK